MNIKKELPVTDGWLVNKLRKTAYLLRGRLFFLYFKIIDTITSTILMIKGSSLSNCFN